ncbi:NECA3 protein, partial [Piaya cayana]|nr:NECA3 protein [Piaya cayana]
MACAELLAVCLLSADRRPAPHRQPLPIFHDVNDGKLSFEEFKNYFADGILSSEELWELFSGIDRRHSDPEGENESSSESCALFQFFSVVCFVMILFIHVFLQRTAQLLSASRCWHDTSSKMEQFLTRFLLRETMHQLQSLQTSLECAVDTVEEQAGRERKDIKKSETLVGLKSGRRCGRRGQKNICLSPTDPYSGMLTTGTILECSSAAWLQELDGMNDLGWGSPGAACHKLWTHLKKNLVGGSCRAVPSLLGLVGPVWAQRGHSLPGPPPQGWFCPRSVSACKLTDEACFILYEFWQDVTSWR